MSDVMLIGVLRMPYEMAMSDELSRMQYHSRGQEASERILADEARIEALERQLAEEKALADRLYDVALFREDDPMPVIDAYRKARGM